MKNDCEKFFDVLFDEGEGICWAKDPYGTQVFAKEHVLDFWNYQFFSINPLLKGADKENPLAEFGRRADINVTAFRNILIECDEGTTNSQAKYIADLGMPFSTNVFSGGKSLHFIISLETPLKSREEYDKLVARIYAKVQRADRANKNPSRLSRNPGALRGGVYQELLWVGSRTPNSALEEWLGPEPVKPVMPKIETKMKPGLSSFTKYFLMFGAAPGTWNKSLFNATCDMVRCNLTEDEIRDRLLNITGSLTKADLKTMKSAIKAANRDLQTEPSE